MSRPADGLAHVAASIARLTAAERPEWASARSWGAARALLASLRADVTEALDDGPTLTAEALGVSRATLARWRGDGGWLAQEDAPADRAR